MQSFIIEQKLSTLKYSSRGLDKLPGCLFKTCSYELAEIVHHIFQISFCFGIVSNEWRVTLVTPIPKVPRASQLSDFRPISVTPWLSRMAEKLFVKYYMRPLLPAHLLDDQYAFRPTGSTSAALIYLLHQVIFT